MITRTLSRQARHALRAPTCCQDVTRTSSAAAARVRFKSIVATATASSTTEASTSASSATLSPSSSASAKDAQNVKSKVKDNDTLPYLPRPLGVREPPTTLRKSWKDETMELMDQDVRIARRKHIVQEATKGYFSEMHATRRHGGKTWIAPKTLIREDHSLYFPDISGTALVDKSTVHTTNLCRGKVSVIGMLSTAISEEHVDSFASLTNSTYLFPSATPENPNSTPNPHYQFLQINLQDNPAKAFLVSLYLSSLRRKIPQILHPHYLLSKQNLEWEREAIGMNNKHIGFVYLVDENLKVRWAGGGLALEEEKESLLRCAKVLLDRKEKGGGKR